MLPADKPCEAPATEVSSGTLCDLLALIQNDAASRPDEYLEETVVPHGGE